MKKLFTLIVSLATVFAATTANANILNNDDTRQAVYGALNQAESALKNAPFGKAPVAILPLRKGHTILAGRLKNLLVQNGFVCVEGKDEPMFEEILKEIEWSERKSDILDADTIVKFGKLKAAKILFQCDIRVIDINADRIYAEIELRATDIATKQVIWGGTFAHRYYIGKNIQGIVSLDDDSRQIIRQSFDKAGKSLVSPQNAGKLSNINTIVVIPINGDVDSYMTDIATAMITRTHMRPQALNIPSLTQLRATARDGLLKSDAVLYGSVRALHKTQPETSQSGKKYITQYNIIAEIQLFIEDAKTGNILWGETISVKHPVVSEREMSAAELKQLRQDKLDAISDDITDDVANNWKSYLKTVIIAVASILGLIAIIIGIKAFISFHNVR